MACSLMRTEAAIFVLHATCPKMPPVERLKVPLDCLSAQKSGPQIDLSELAAQKLKNYALPTGAQVSPKRCAVGRQRLFSFECREKLR